jgi:hypothetical protein
MSEKILNVKSKEDLARFVNALKDDLRANPTEWQNQTLEMYFDAMTAWIESIETFYRNSGRQVPDPPTWSTLADILFAPKYYE